FAALGYATTDDNGSFYLESGRADAPPAGTSVRLRFEVLDGRLDMIHATEQEVALEAPDQPVDITLTVSLTGRREAVGDGAPRSRADVAGIRVLPDPVTVPLGGRVVLIAEAHDDNEVPVGAVPVKWQA